MSIFLLILFILWIISKLLPYLDVRLPKINRRKFGNQAPNIFEHHYLESKAFYVYRFKNIPSTTFVDDIDVAKAFTHVRELYGQLIADVYQACFFNRQEKKQQFRKTILVLKNKVIIELASDYARILYAPVKYDFADSLITALSEFKLPEKARDFEINVITFSNNGLDLKPLAIKPTTFDLDLCYNDDFKE